MALPKIMQRYERVGDKKNSDFFEEHVTKVYKRREDAGIDKNLKNIRAVMVQTNIAGAVGYMAELALMTPYRFYKGFVGETHKIYILKNQMGQNTLPNYIILEPISEDFNDEFVELNSLYQKTAGRKARYLGEIFQVEDKTKVATYLKEIQIRTMKAKTTRNCFLADSNILFTRFSEYSHNTLGYTESDLSNFNDFDLGESFELTEAEQNKIAATEKIHNHFKLNELIRGLDHLASRVYTQNRENAILEYLSLSKYYFWGAYNIEAMNSSTNVTRHPDVADDILSPAKVFTANNTPFIVGSINGLPSPTEDFVRNFGPRMHHLAYEVVDGEQEDKTKNIDYVVGKLIDAEIPFLAKIIGDCKDIPDLKQIFSKASPHSIMITEYVQRCKKFAGFFTKTNVAVLTQAAGEDERLD